MDKIDKLKYKVQLKALEPQPDLSNFLERTKTLYRFCHNPFIDSDFLPALINKPNRDIDPTPRYKGFSLSCFETLEFAQNKINGFIKKGKPNIVRALGDHFCRGHISVGDGISDTPNKDGHISFFEYESDTFFSKFVIINNQVDSTS